MDSGHARPVQALIAGAQKAGTTSLAAYLSEHPDICTHTRDEFSYFVDELDFSNAYADTFARYFAHCPKDAVVLAKSATVMTDPRLIERVKHHNPDTRVIVSLRNPVDRAYSAFWWARRMGYEPIPTFEQALAATPERHDGNVVKIRSTSYVEFGEYARQVADLMAVLGRERVKIVLFDDLRADPQAVLHDLFRFIGVDATFEASARERRNVAGQARSSAVARFLVAQSPAKRRIRQLMPRGWAEALKRRAQRLNTSSFRPPPMEPATRQRLVAHFVPHNAQLSELLRRDLSHWDQ
jgi:hypothetical protein